METDLLLASRTSTHTSLIYHNFPFPLPHPGTLKHMYTHTHTHTRVWVTLTFSGSALFWVSPRASNAITAMMQEKPRMLSMFLEQNTFSSDSKIKRRRENINKKWTDIDFPPLSVRPCAGFLETAKTDKRWSLSKRHLQSNWVKVKKHKYVFVLWWGPKLS